MSIHKSKAEWQGSTCCTTRNLAANNNFDLTAMNQTVQHHQKKRTTPRCCQLGSTKVGVSVCLGDSSPAGERRPDTSLEVKSLGKVDDISGSGVSSSAGLSLGRLDE